MEVTTPTTDLRISNDATTAPGFMADFLTARATDPTTRLALRPDYPDNHPNNHPVTGLPTGNQVDVSSELSFYLHDHLGNTVVLFEDKNGDGVIQENPDDPEISEVLQRELYYPFGLQLRGTAPIQPSTDQRYLYNGKEQMEGTGLYAYGFRYYDPVIGRFTGVDPIADQFAFVSGFNYAENSPINGIDLHGLQFVDSNDAFIYIHNGGASLKFENLGAGLKGKIRTSIFKATVNSDGSSSIGTNFSRRVIETEGFSPELLAIMPSNPSGIRSWRDRAKGSSSQRRRTRRALERQGLKPGALTVFTPPPPPPPPPTTTTTTTGRITSGGKGAGAA
jgi:RHS repeat-associated protein